MAIASAPPPAWLEVQLSTWDNSQSLYYPTPLQAGPGDVPARSHAWREIQAPRACDGALWLWIATTAARRVYGWCPAHVVLVRHQGANAQTLLDVHL